MLENSVEKRKLCSMWYPRYSIVSFHLYRIETEWNSQEKRVPERLKVCRNMGKSYDKNGHWSSILNCSEFIKRRKILVYGSIWDGRTFNIQFYCVLVCVHMCVCVCVWKCARVPFRKSISKTKRVEGYFVCDTKKGFLSLLPKSFKAEHKL